MADKRSLVAWMAVKQMRPNHGSAWCVLQPATMAYLDAHVEFLQRVNEYLYQQMKERNDEL